LNEGAASGAAAFLAANWRRHPWQGTESQHLYLKGLRRTRSTTDAHGKIAKECALDGGFSACKVLSLQTEKVRFMNPLDNLNPQLTSFRPT